MPSVGWIFNRLRLMGPAEIAWRGYRAFRVRFEKIRAAPAVPPPQSMDTWGGNWLAASPAGIEPDRYLHAADRIMAGSYRLFALRDLNLGFPPRWNRDPKTGTEAPLCFGKTLDYRSESLVGDIKYLWEINRHYELVTLAQAFHLSGRNEYAQACRTLLDSWFDQCPFPLGPNWTSSLEHGIRLTNWSAAWHLLGGNRSSLFEDEDGTRFRRRWLDAIYRHCGFIASHLSRYSSANNHLFGEYMGLFVGATTWPCWRQSIAWAEEGRNGLEAEALKQIGADGVHLEQAIWYHHEVADMMLLCALCGRCNGIAFSGAYWKRLEAMLEFIAATMDVNGNMPMIGDSDDAVMVRFSQEPDFNVYRSLLATGAILFGRADFKRKAGWCDDKTGWLLEDAAAFEGLSADEGNSTVPRVFPNGGYYLLGSDPHSLSEVRIVVDAGPLGYLSIAAHGHADALALTLSAGGAELLIDPGTYAYHTQKKWRSYFRGTSAHNTVRIDGRDQSEQGGNFMWLRKARATCELWESNEKMDCFAGSHDGYLHLADPVMHKRKLMYLKRERTLVVEDILQCRASHDVEFWWHFAEHCNVTASESGLLARSGNARLEMTMQDDSRVPEFVCGREQPPAGWISRRFDEKRPSPSVVWKERINGAVRRITVMRIDID